MGSDAITVQRLRVKALWPALAQGMGGRMAEALRIASKPPALANRFVLIRRLHLSVPPAASAQTIALLIEREWQRVLGSAVLIDEAEATAEVVWAPGEGQARVALLARWLADDDDSAWFWQRIAPASAPAGLPLAERIAALLIEPPAEEVVVAAEVSPSWWREALPLLARHRRLPELLSLLPAQPRSRLQWLIEEMDVRDLELWPTVPVVEARPDPEQMAGPVPGQTVVTKRAFVPKPGESPAIELLPGKVLPAPVRDEVPAIKGAEAAAPVPVAMAPPTAAATESAARPVEMAPARSPSNVAPSRPSLAPLRGQATAWAGLWLLVPVLLRQGFAAEPLAPNDPRSRHQAEVFVALLQGSRERYCLDAVAGDWIDQQSGASTEAARTEAEAWWLKARHACVRDARLPLLRLLRRPGELLLSDHRIDVVMPLRTLDIRLRRAGFDIDPGYLPWLDVVLRFHYA